MLKVENISFSYDHVKILNKINVEVPDGKVVCLMGRNGVGKTTLLRNIVGLENPSSGKIYYNNSLFLFFWLFNYYKGVQYR